MLQDQPKDPQNRRLSIVMLRGTGKKPDVGADSNPDAILRNRDDADRIGNSPQPIAPAPTEPSATPTSPQSSGAIPPAGSDSSTGGALPPPARDNNKGGLKGLILRR